jgi:hypothetical protein
MQAEKLTMPRTYKQQDYLICNQLYMILNTQIEVSKE